MFGQQSHDVIGGLSILSRVVTSCEDCKKWLVYLLKTACKQGGILINNKVDVYVNCFIYVK